MTVEELIIELQKMPQKARVFHLWDGAPRTAINVVYESKNGKVITADWDSYCYSCDNAPKDCTTSEFGWWETPKNPHEVGKDPDDII